MTAARLRSTDRGRAGFISRRAKPITARATGLRLRRIFPKAEKPPIATLSLMQFALSAVIFGSRRGRRASVTRASRGFDGLRRVETKGKQAGKNVSLLGGYAALWLAC